MDIQIYASGSSGNLYKISDGTTSLLLECGLSISQIRKHLCFRLSEVDACLVTHEHGDHAKAVKEIMNAGIDLYLSQGTKKALGIDSHRVMVIKPKEPVEINSFIVFPFDTEHDAAEPLGFVLQSKVTGERLLYATDTYYIKYQFPGLTQILIECNYSFDILAQNIQEGIIPVPLKNRILHSHFSLDNVKGFLRANDLSKVKEIYLIHISKDNGYPERFQKEIQELTGKQVYI
jgi:phosphoribosyl 1,2-cyclic phosphodiesterase